MISRKEHAMNTNAMNTNAVNTNREDLPGGMLDTVVVGGGQSGLAIGYYLAQQGRSFLIIDAHHRVGDAWRERWDSLRLFTPAKYDGLPGLPFPGDPLSFPRKDDLADYLEAYARHFDLPLSLGVRVDRLWREDSHWAIAAGERRWEALNVVVATGGSQQAKTPSFAEQLDPSIVSLHSTGYYNPSQLQEGTVLVVGVGNSGAEIALEVSRTHETLLSGKPSAEIPFRHGRTAARYFLPIVRFLGSHVLTLNNPIGRKVAPGFRRHGTPLIRTKLADLAAAGVQSVPRVVGVEDGKPVVEGGQVLDVANVLWCTGYRPDVEWVDAAAFDDDGQPVQRRGVALSTPGLYFLGQEFLFAATSATLAGICRDARYLAAQLPAGSTGTVRPSRQAGHQSAIR